EIEQYLIVEGILQAVILWNLTITADFWPGFGLIKNSGIIQSFRFPVLHGAAHFELLRVPDHFVDRAKTKLRHMLAHLLRDKSHKVDHVRRIAGELFSEFGILRCHAIRTGIEVAATHHDTAQAHTG